MSNVSCIGTITVPFPCKHKQQKRVQFSSLFLHLKHTLQAEDSVWDCYKKNPGYFYADVLTTFARSDEQKGVFCNIDLQKIVHTLCFFNFIFHLSEWIKENSNARFSLEIENPCIQYLGEKAELFKSVNTDIFLDDDVTHRDPPCKNLASEHFISHVNLHCLFTSSLNIFTKMNPRLFNHFSFRSIFKHDCIPQMPGKNIIIVNTIKDGTPVNFRSIESLCSAYFLHFEQQAHLDHSHLCPCTESISLQNSFTDFLTEFAKSILRTTTKIKTTRQKVAFKCYLTYIRDALGMPFLDTPDDTTDDSDLTKSFLTASAHVCLSHAFPAICEQHEFEKNKQFFVDKIIDETKDENKQTCNEILAISKKCINDFIGDRNCFSETHRNGDCQDTDCMLEIIEKICNQSSINDDK